MLLPTWYNRFLGWLRGTCAHCGFATADRCPQCHIPCCILCANEQDDLCPTCHPKEEQEIFAHYRQIVQQVVEEQAQQQRTRDAYAAQETVVALPAMQTDPRSLRAIAWHRQHERQSLRTSGGEQAPLYGPAGRQTEPLPVAQRNQESIRRLRDIQQEERARARIQQRKTH